MRRIHILLAFAGAALGISAFAQQDGFKRYADENDKKQAALEGKAPPAIVASEWLNSKPLTWQKLRGKVVLLDLWAYW